jgi:ABC-type transport system substrate-binding protein
MCCRTPFTVLPTWEDPIVGGYTPDKVALRRAVSLAYDVAREVRLIRRGSAIPAQSPMVPFCSGYDPAFKSEMSDYDPARSRALLDMYGYTDRDGDGWRETPEGKPLVLEYASQPDQIYREFNNLVRRGLKDVGLRVEFPVQQWPEQLKRAQAGKLQMWSLGLSSSDPDGATGLQYYYGPQAGQQNIARFKLPEMDHLYRQLIAMPDGPEREALFLQTKRIAVAYMPYRYIAHRMGTEVLHARVHGYRRAVFWNNWWHMVDVDADTGVDAPCRSPPRRWPSRCPWRCLPGRWPVRPCPRAPFATPFGWPRPASTRPASPTCIRERSRPTSLRVCTSTITWRAR